MLDKNFFTKLNEAEDAALEKQLMASRQHRRDVIVQSMEVACNDYMDEMGLTAYRREMKRRT
jgi:hypothetical protein